MPDDLDAQRLVIVTMPQGIDAGNANAVGDTLDAVIAQGAMAVIVDCTPTTFCDSVGFNTLILANQKAREANARLLFVIALNGQLRRVLELLKMQDALEMYPSVDAAVAAAAASRQLPSRRLAEPGAGTKVPGRFIVGLGKIDMGLVRITLAIAVGAAVTACSGPGTGRPTRAAPASYYLALGDSLARGVQPDAAGASVQTRQGYANQVYAALRHGRPGLRLVKLGCPGETTRTMIAGGICRYRGGSQLAAAVAFLRAHHGHVLLVTIDIGANDAEDCGSGQGISKVTSCFWPGLPQALGNLATILSRIRAAAGPRVPIAGMSYYLPALAVWRTGLVGRAVAWIAERLAAGYDDLIRGVYLSYGARVADVFAAFGTADFGHPVTETDTGTLPRNVAMICRLTWECANPPQGPNQHPNQAGYAVIARTFLRAVDLSY